MTLLSSSPFALVPSARPGPISRIPSPTIRLLPPAPQAAQTSRYLSPANAYEFANKCLFAEWSGCWLNVSTTFAWSKCAGFEVADPGAPQAFLRAAVRCIDEFLGRRGVSPFYAWVKEDAPTARCDIHHHLLLHLPLKGYNELLWEVRDRLGELFSFAPAGLMVKGSREMKGARPGRPAYASRREVSIQLIYFLKNLDPAAKIRHEGRLVPFRSLIRLGDLAKRFNVGIGEPLPVPVGKREGGAERLGPKARAAAGWHEINTPEALSQAIELGYSRVNDPQPPPSPLSRCRNTALRRALSTTGRSQYS